MTQVMVGGSTIEWASHGIRNLDGTWLLDVGGEAMVTDVLSVGDHLVVVLLRGTASQEHSNVIALDAATGREAWRVKKRPGSHDDELVGMEVDGYIVKTWSWNLVYQVDSRTGELVDVHPNR